MSHHTSNSLKIRTLLQDRVVVVDMMTLWNLNHSLELLAGFVIRWGRKLGVSRVVLLLVMSGLLVQALSLAHRLIIKILS